jgi:hypothetical protein
VRLEGLGKMKKFSDLIGTEILDVQACSIVPQPTILPRVPLLRYILGTKMNLRRRLRDIFGALMIMFCSLECYIRNFTKITRHISLTCSVGDIKPAIYKCYVRKDKT